MPHLLLLQPAPDMVQMLGSQITQWALGGSLLAAGGGLLWRLSHKVERCATKASVAVLARKLSDCATSESVHDVAQQLGAFEARVMAILQGATGDNGVAGTLAKVEKRTGMLEQRASTLEATVGGNARQIGRALDQISELNRAAFPPPPPPSGRRANDR